MKLDYEKIKSILSALRNNDKPTINTHELASNLAYDLNDGDSTKELWYYLTLLKDQNLVECIGDGENNMGFSFTGAGHPIISIRDFRLTMSGHQTLEAMTEKKVWKRVADPLKKLGIAGLKQIPSLAVKLLTSDS